MHFKPRILTNTINEAIKTFPAVLVTGPRQSGKTTLLKKIFSKSHKFISLENPDVRIRAKDDPNAFLTQYSPPVIIDEIQYVPELFSYIKTEIDENRKPGNWLFTGSQNFQLLSSISQSLAGRVAILTLLPFSIQEKFGDVSNSKNIAEWLKALSIALEEKTGKKSFQFLKPSLLRGFYPEIACNNEVNRQLWCGSYITTYLERDIRNLTKLGDLNQFERFVRLCATRTGQILKISEMARDIGISVTTAKRWISLLEAGYQIFLLYPFYRNLGKRIIKSPKLYFADTALCTYLLGINDFDSLYSGPSYGSLFETMIINDILKRFTNYGEKPSMYYFRTRDGLEVDLVIEYQGELNLIEIKSGMTIIPKHALSLTKLKNGIKDKIGNITIISASVDSGLLTNNTMNLNWFDILNI